MTEPGERSGDGAAGYSDWFSPTERAAAAAGSDGDWSPPSLAESQEPVLATSEDAWLPGPGDSTGETGRGLVELQLAVPDSGDADLSLAESQALALTSSEDAWLPGPADSSGETGRGPAELQLAMPETTDPDLSPVDQPGLPAEFRVRCPDCGPQRVAVTDVRFVQTGADAQANRYMFTCPECGKRVRRPAGPELAEVLRNAGVATLALHRGSGEAI